MNLHKIEIRKLPLCRAVKPACGSYPFLPLAPATPTPILAPQAPSSAPIGDPFILPRDRTGWPMDLPWSSNMTAAMDRHDSSATATLTSYKYWPDLDWRLCNYSKNCCLGLRQPQDMSGQAQKGHTGQKQLPPAQDGESATAWPRQRHRP